MANTNFIYVPSSRAVKSSRFTLRFIFPQTGYREVMKCIVFLLYMKMSYLNVKNVIKLVSPASLIVKCVLQI